jgi:hypothetical protein
MSWILDQKEVHMTVASSLQMRGDLPDLRNDLQMVKAALLYADRAKLVSISSFALLDIIRGLEVRGPEKLAQLKEIFSRVDDEQKRRNVNEWIAQYEYAKRRRHSKRGRELLKRLDDALDKAYLKAQEGNAASITELGGEGIFDAVNSGVLDIYAFESIFDRVIRQALNGDELELEYISAVSNVVSDTHTYPLFDDETSRIISSRITDGSIPVTVPEIKRSKEVALAADLLARLPLF